MTYSFVDEPPRISQILYRPPERVHHKGKQTSWGPATLLFVYCLKEGVVSSVSDLDMEGEKLPWALPPFLLTIPHINI